MAYIYDGILIDKKNDEENTDICYNLDETWKHVKWKKPVLKDYILYNSIYMLCPEYANVCTD